MFRSIKPTTIISSLVLVITIGAIIFTSWALYNRTSQILDTNLRERLLSIVTTAAVEFDAEDIKKLQVEEDWKRPEWAKVVNKMVRIRKNNDKILFIYMFRKNPSDPTKMEFVADSHSLDPYAKIDLNNDGVVDDADQLQWPGQEYDVTDIPDTFEAYNGPTTNRDIYSDQWGPVLTGYSPIKDSYGNIVAILAVDIKAGDFAIITSQTLYPFLIFICVLSIIISALLFTLIYYWARNSKYLQAINKQIQSQNQKISQQNKKIALQKTSLEELLKMKEETLHIVNHQINTPIYAIRSAVAMFQDKIWPQDRFLQVVDAETKRITETVAQFLAARKVDDGKLIINKTLTDFGTLVKTLINEKNLLKKVRENNVQIKFTEPEDIPPVKMDMPKITEVVSNLLDNAINYSTKDIFVDLKRDGKNVIFSVKDSGIGIPKDKVNDLFKRFSRLENAKKVRPDGTGLGLYVCRQIAEGHKGTLWAKSDGEGQGSTFSLSLPISD